MNDTQLYSEQTKNWTVSGVNIQEDIDSASGYSAVIGLLAQTVALTDGENYILSFKAKGTALSAVCGSLNETVPVTAEYQRFIFKFTAAQAVSVVFNGTATICEIMLERGTIVSEWRASYLDNDKSFAEFKAYQYLMSAIRDGSTDIIGGLVLTNMLQVGNYKNGILQKVTGGKSGIYNDDNDVSDWGGGTYDQAVYTVMKYLDDPTYQPTEEELVAMAKWVATHGGRFILNDAIVRGTVYADSGVFRGKVYAEDGEFTGTIHATDGSFSGTFKTSIGNARIEIKPTSIGPQIIAYNQNNVMILKIDAWFDSAGGTSPHVEFYDPTDFRNYAQHSIRQSSWTRYVNGSVKTTVIEAGRLYMIDGFTVVYDINKQ